MKINKYQNYDPEKYNVYKIETKSKIDVKKILIIVMIIVAIVALIFVISYSINSIKQYNAYKEYEAKLIAHKQEEERKQAEIAADQERKRQEKIPKLTEIGKQNLANIYHSESKRAFLTFDDGPSTVTSSILDTLKSENVKATFFVLGSRVDAMPEMVKRIYDEGHYIANHGYTHVYSSIYSSPQAVLDEFNHCNESVRNAIGVLEYNSHLFRFPGGFPGGPYVDMKNQAKELLNQNDILNVDWNALTGDSEKSKPTVEFEMQRLQETVSGKNSVVILMHDAQAKKATAEALLQIIQYLKNEGYEFKNFYEIIK